jgi:putative heme-binding domain-containing protein
MPMPAGWPAVYAKLKASNDAAVRENATLVALVFDDPLALSAMRERALNTAAPLAQRQSALQALIEKRKPDLAPLLHDLLDDKSLRRIAILGLASTPHDETPGRILARYTDLSPEERQAAVATLASRKEYALELLGAAERKEVSRTDISAYVARQLYALGDAEVTERLQKVWGEVRDTLPQRQEQLARYKNMLTPSYLERADLKNGRQLYVKTCQQCHVLFGEGSKIGPDLTGANRANLDYLLSNILDPSAEIGRDFRMSVVSTTDGRVLTGMILERMPGRVTIQTATERVVLASDEIELLKDSTVSMMPEGQFENLTKEQVRDLVAYIAAPGKGSRTVGLEVTPEKITIDNPRELSAEPIPGERVPLGEPDDYKPCIARLPDGELLLTAFHQHPREGNKVLEQTLLFRSHDGGRSWSQPEKLNLLGREPYLTVLPDGTIFLTGHLLANDERNRWGYTCGFLHRSTDGGRTWKSIRIESEGIRPGAGNHTSRNVLQLADKTLLLGVDYDGGSGPHLMWRSTDGGQTWDKSQKCQPKEFKSQYGFFGGETWLWPARSGKIWALVRVDSNELPIKDRPIQAGNDQADHYILFSSADQGRTFERGPDFGDYGEMYMSLLRLPDERLLLTFTVRDLKPPLGVRALLGVESETGFSFDFSRDRIMLDAKTGSRAQGGGFGPTVQLADGSLVTSYSYRGLDNKTHLEIVRWKPPQPTKVR